MLAGLLAGVCLTIVFFRLAQRYGISAVKQQASARAAEVRQDDENEFALALAEAFQLWKNPELNNAQKLEAAIGIAIKHPRVAGKLMKMAKKLLSGKGGVGFEGLLGGGEAS